MTRKDYERFASMMQQLRGQSRTQTELTEQALRTVEESLANALAADNPAGFKRDRFLKVCRQSTQRTL